jgi:acetate kinase
MTEARPDLNVLALNSGSSSLKFGLHRVGSSRTQMLLSGEAEAIGEENSKFHAEDAHEDALHCETVPIPSQREAIIRIGGFLPNPECRRRSDG